MGRGVLHITTSGWILEGFKTGCEANKAPCNFQHRGHGVIAACTAQGRDRKEEACQTQGICYFWARGGLYNSD